MKTNSIEVNELVHMNRGFPRMAGLNSVHLVYVAHFYFYRL